MSISQIDRETVRQICVSQVVNTVGGAVKELIENALDAGATEVTVRTTNWGVAEIVVEDNGKGIRGADFANIVSSHATSKIGSFTDISGVETFGFRGEALSALCGLAHMTVHTKHKDDSLTSDIVFTPHQTIESTSTTKAPFSTSSSTGTAVTLKDLFYTLTVRRKELLRSGKTEYQKCIRLIQEYCVASHGVQIKLLNRGAVGKPYSVLVASKGKSIIENVHEVFGMQVAQDMQKVNLKLANGMIFSGLISKPIRGCGRVKTDARFMYIRGRPVDIRELGNKINLAYRRLNQKERPIFFLNISGEADAFDVNVTPDKRTVLMKGVSDVCEDVFEAFKALWETERDGAPATPTQHTPSALKQMRWGDDSRLEQDSEQIIVPDRFAEAAAQQATQAAETHSAESFLNIRKKATEGRIGKELSFDDTEDALPTLPKETQCTAKSEEMEIDPREPRTPPTITKAPQIATPKPTPPTRKRERSEETAPLMATPTPPPSPPPTRKRERSEETVPLIATPSELPPRKRARTRDVNVDVDVDADSCACCSATPPNTTTTPTNPTEPQDLTTPPTRRAPRRTAPQRTQKASPESDSIGEYETGSMVEVDPPASPPKMTTPPKSAKKKGKGKKKKDAAPAEIVAVSIRRGVVEGEGEGEGSAAETALSVRVSGVAEEVLSAHPAKVCVVAARTADEVERPKKRIRFSFDDIKTRLQAPCAPVDASLNRPAWSKYSGKSVKCEEELANRVSKADFAKMRVIGQFNKGFIVAGLGAELFLIDQHASDEKYNFERLKAAYQITPQPLVQARPLCIPAGDALLLREYVHVFTQNGFRFRFLEGEDVDPNQRILVTAVPMSYNTTFTDHDIQEVIAILKEIPGARSVRPTRTTAMLASRACRSSVMIGTALDRREMRTLVRHMGTMSNPWNCPHGRPTLRHLTSLSHPPLKGTAHPMSTPVADFSLHR